MISQTSSWTVRDYMTDVPLSVRPDTRMAAAFMKMRIGHFRHLPVVDAGRQVGMLTDRDMRHPHMKEAAHWHELYDVDDERPVSDVMTCDVRTVDPEQPLTDAVDLFVDKGYGALPVIDREGSLVGILSVYDVLRATKTALRSGEAE